MGSIPSRLVLAIMAFLMFLVTQMIRSNLYIAVVAIKDQYNASMLALNSTVIEARDDGTGVLLGAFYWTYWLTELPGGLLANRYGARKLLGIGVFLAAVLNLLLPVACHHHYMTAAVVRSLQGLALGVTWPATHWLSARWIPSTERSKFMTSYHGAAVGTALTYPLSGLLINTYGWESVFYFVGGITIVWCVAWFALVYDSPSEHPRITTKEKQFLAQSLGNVVSNHKSDRLPTPWRDILSSKPFWAVTVASQGLMWGTITLSMQIPTYFHQVHGLDIKTNGLLSGVPETCKFLLGIVISFVMDRLLQRKYCSVTAIRKISVVTCEYLPAIFLVILAYCGSSSILLATALLAMTSAVGGASSSGSLANIVDLSPNHAGTILGLIKTATVIPGVISPLLVTYLTETAEPGSWKIVFVITAAVYTVCCTVFLIFGSGEVQYWNNKNKKSKDMITMLSPVSK